MTDIGIGGAPTRATTLPEDPAERKQYPVASGVLDYFPDALVAVAHVSWKGNEQHNPGQPLHWARGKSTDESDTMIRHYLQRGSRDTDGERHSAKMAWRALAILQKEIEEEHQQERKDQAQTDKSTPSVSVGKWLHVCGCRDNDHNGCVEHRTGIYYLRGDAFNSAKGGSKL